VDSLLESDTTPFMLYGMIGALPDALALLAAHDKLPAAKVHHILVTRCTTQRRDAIQRMAELDDVIRRRALSALDTCLPTTKALEPIFRRWLAPKVSGSTPDERAR
jgi:hypothetical protein